MFYHCLQKEHPKLSLAGAIAFAVGLTSAVSIGFLAPFTHGYTPLHVQLASAAFIGIFAGAWLHLLAARVAPALLILQLAALLIVSFLCYGPVDFNNDRLLISLAFWEWVLCLDCGVALWALARKVERMRWSRGVLPARLRAQIKHAKACVTRHSDVGPGTRHAEANLIREPRFLFRRGLPPRQDGATARHERGRLHHISFR